MWSMSGVINVLFHTRCDQCLVWSMSFFTHSVINVWCDQCPVWWMSGVINVWCDQCPISHTVWSMSGVINVRCDQCPFLHTVWSMSGVINVCVINVVQSSWLYTQGRWTNLISLRVWRIMKGGMRWLIIPNDNDAGQRSSQVDCFLMNWPRHAFLSCIHSNIHQNNITTKIIENWGKKYHPCFLMKNI